MFFRIHTACLVLGLFLSGCADKRAPVAPVGGPGDPLEARSTTPAQREAVSRASASNEGGGLSFSADVLRLCPGVRAPRFGYDSAELRAAWSDALTTLGDCLKKGGLKDKSLVLTGHTDPRGDEDYNMALGSRRAEATKAAISEFGVDGSRLSTSSKGEAEARGTDEESWAKDRRVDISLRQ